MNNNAKDESFRDSIATIDEEGSGHGFILKNRKVNYIIREQ